MNIRVKMGDAIGLGIALLVIVGTVIFCERHPEAVAEAIVNNRADAPEKEEKKERPHWNYIPHYDYAAYPAITNDESILEAIRILYNSGKNRIFGSDKVAIAEKIKDMIIDSPYYVTEQVKTEAVKALEDLANWCAFSSDKERIEDMIVEIVTN